MTDVQLKQTASVNLDGSGNGTASIGPLSAREVWHPDNVHVQVTPRPATNEAQCNIYIGVTADDSTWISGTQSGSTGDSGGSVDGRDVRMGEKVWAIWTGGDPSKQATLTITGTRTI